MVVKNTDLGRGHTPTHLVGRRCDGIRASFGGRSLSNLVSTRRLLAPAPAPVVGREVHLKPPCSAAGYLRATVASPKSGFPVGCSTRRGGAGALWCR